MSYSIVEQSFGRTCANRIPKASSKHSSLVGYCDFFLGCCGQVESDSRLNQHSFRCSLFELAFGSVLLTCFQNRQTCIAFDLRRCDIYDLVEVIDEIVFEKDPLDLTYYASLLV